MCSCENILVSTKQSHTDSYNDIVVWICCLWGRYFSPSIRMTCFVLLLVYLWLLTCSSVWIELSIFCLLFLFRLLELISGDLVSVCVLISENEIGNSFIYMEIKYISVSINIRHQLLVWWCTWWSASPQI